MIEDALVIGTVSSQPAAQCGRANVERIGDFFRTKPEQIPVQQQIDYAQRGARQLMGCLVCDANAEFRGYLGQRPLRAALERVPGIS